MTLDEQIAIIQAVKDGKTVKILSLETESLIGYCKIEHHFDFIRYRYEIQREPMEIWVNVYQDNSFSTHATRAEACFCLPGRACDGRTVKFREVLDD